jgi:ribosome-associated protein
MQVMSTEGEDNGEWIIVDCGAAVAHIMQPAIREYYHLEEIWGGKSVRLKLGEVNTKLVKASEPEPPQKAEPARSAVKSKPPRPPMKKPAVHTAAGKTAVKKAANKSAAYKRVGAKRPAAKTAATQKAPARRAPRPA